MERLQKVIANSGECSRRKAEELIINGKVSVNGEIVRELGTKVSSSDLIVVNAKGIKGVSCPSKYYGLAACAKPVLGVLEEGSEVRYLIEETNGGNVKRVMHMKKLF